MNNKVSLEDILATIQNWQLEAKSGYNDGWMIEHYTNNINKIKEQLEIKQEPQLIT
jgi:hypothetical protein